MRRPTNLINGLDWFTISLYLVLVLMGWLNIYSAVYDDQNASIISMSQRYGKQLLWIITAIGLATIICLIDTRFYSTFAYPIYVFCLLVLAAVLVVGKEVNSSKSWIYLGSFQIQPSEFAKLATSLALAKYLGNYAGKFMAPYNIFKVVVIMALPVGLILLQHDIGSCLVFAAFIFVLYREGLPTVFMLLMAQAIILALFALSLEDAQAWITGGVILLGFIVYWFYNRRAKPCFYGMGIYFGVFAIFMFVSQLLDNPLDLNLLLLGAAVVTGLFFVLLSIFKRLPFVRTAVIFVLCSLFFASAVHTAFEKLLDPYQQKRVLVTLGKLSDPKGIEYNVDQSKIAIGSGGWLGKGYLQGTQTKFNFVPEQSTDFIFCTVGEEWGFAGAFVVITLFVVLLLRLIYLAERQRSVFSRVYGYCVVSILFLHLFINIGMAVDMLPVIGIPLPFFSYGGSSLWAFTILLFIFLRLDYSRDEYIR